MIMMTWKTRLLHFERSTVLVLPLALAFGYL